jgi:predicted CoA-binding protein
MQATKKSITQFLTAKKIAVAGASRNPKKFGNVVVKELRQRGFEIYPVNPYVDIINGEPCYHSIAALPVDVKHMIVVTPKAQTLSILEDALRKGIDNIWIQQMSDTPEALGLLTGKEINLITRQCILMWTEPVKGIHKFHRAFMRFFGLGPR